MMWTSVEGFLDSHVGATGVQPRVAGSQAIHYRHSAAVVMWSNCNLQTHVPFLSLQVNSSSPRAS